MNKEMTTIYNFAPNIAWQIEPVDQMVYVLNKKNDKFLYFDGVSKDIWLLISKKMSVRDIISDIV